MAFSVEQIAQRQAAIKAKEQAEARRLEEDERRGLERQELAERLMSEYPGVKAYHLTLLWDCATLLTDKVVKEFTSGAAEPSSSTLTWADAFKGDERLGILHQMACSYNNVGQIFSIEFTNNLTLPRHEKAGSPQVRVRCTVKVDT